VHTVVVNSVHYREVPTLTEYNNFTIKTLADVTKYGSSIYSTNSISMFAGDDVFFRTSLPINGAETLSGASSNILAVIPLTSGTAAQTFYQPDSLLSTTIPGSMSLSQLSIRLTDGDGDLHDLNGNECSFTLRFECFDNFTYANKPPEMNHIQKNEDGIFSNAHRGSNNRHPAHMFQ
jgi:hypothetical protein